MITTFHCNHWHQTTVASKILSMAVLSTDEIFAVYYFDGKLSFYCLGVATLFTAWPTKVCEIKNLQDPWKLENLCLKWCKIKGFLRD